MLRQDNLPSGEIFETRYNQMLEVSFADISSYITDDTNKATKDEYNQLARTPESLHFGCTIDPLAILPPEIWMDIVQEAASKNERNLSATDALLLLTLVNDKWRTKIIDSPGLWTNIMIGHGEADAQAKLGTAICLSRDLPLKLTINTTPCQWDDDRALLQPHANRIKHIIFLQSKRTKFDEDATAQFLHQFFPSLGYLPSLRVIQRSVPSTLDWDDVFVRAPALTYLYGQLAPFDKIAWSRDEAVLLACCMYGMSSEIIPRLGDLVHLKELTWSEDDDVEIYHGKQILPSLPSLRSIDSWGINNPNFLAILRLTGNLTYLRLTIRERWEYLRVFFHVLGELPHLVALHLFFEDIPDPFSFYVTHSVTTRIRDLQIANYCDENEESSLPALFSIFPTFFPNVTALEVGAVPLGRELVEYISSLPRLRALQLSYMSALADFGILIESPTLDVLGLKGTSLELLAIMKCPLLSRVSLDHATFEVQGLLDGQNDSWGDDTSVYDIFKAPYMKLSKSHWELQWFSSLRKVCLGDDSNSTGRLLIGLILKPRHFPHLQEIQLGAIPEWDLLFSMLERRNYVPSFERITRIETLILPSPIQPVLLAPLAELLGGSIAKRPKNHDLCFLSFMEAYFDPSISGCQRCIRSTISCSTVPGPREGGLDCFNSLPLPNTSPDVPTELWAWLQAREDRLQEWTARHDVWDKGPLSRVQQCAEMQLAQQPFTITSHSFSGLHWDSYQRDYLSL